MRVCEWSTVTIWLPGCFPIAHCKTRDAGWVFIDFNWRGWKTVHTTIHPFESRAWPWCPSHFHFAFGNWGKLQVHADHHFPIFSIYAQVNWLEEEPCFHDLARELAQFYSSRPCSVAGKHGAVDNSYGRLVQHVLFPAFKKSLMPATSMGTDGCLVEVSSAFMRRFFKYQACPVGRLHACRSFSKSSRDASHSEQGRDEVLH